VIARAPWGTRMLRTTIPPESVLPPPPRAPSALGPRVDPSEVSQPPQSPTPD